MATTQVKLAESVKQVIRGAAARMGGFQRRAFQAEMAETYCGGVARQAEKVFGWGRETVETGLGERRTGIRCRNNYQARGRWRSEKVDPELAQKIHALAEPVTEADPKLFTPFGYTRITAKAVHQQLFGNAQKTNGETNHETDDKTNCETDSQTARPVLTVQTVSNMLNRLGYRLRAVQKSEPKKKFRKPTKSSSTCEPLMTPPRLIPRSCASRSTPKRKSK